MKKTVIMTSLVALMFLVGPAVALDIDVRQNEAESAALSQDYVAGPAGDVSWALGEEGVIDCEPLLAQLCFEWSGESSAEIEFNDDSTLEVSAYVVFVGSEGAGSVCGSQTVDVPDGTSAIHVYMNGVVFGAADCGATPATTGSVSVS